MNFNMLIEFLLCKGKQDVNYMPIIELITELLNLHAVTVFLLGCHVLEGMCAVDAG